MIYLRPQILRSLSGLLLALSLGASTLLSAPAKKPTKPEEPPPVPPPPVLVKERGKFSTLSGRFIDRDARQKEDGWFRIMRVDGVATQEDLVISVSRPGADQSIPPPLPGEHYTFRGFEGGHWLSADNQPVLTPNKTSRFVPHFFATRESPIPPITYQPNQFIGRVAWFQGTAANLPEGPILQSSNWTLWLDGQTPWPDAIAGKTAEAYGTVEQGPTYGHFRLKNAVASLSKLEDQVGQTVTLRGRPRGKNSWWWFEVRGQNLYVEKLAQLPGFLTTLNGKDVIISGKLEKKAMPRLEKVLDGDGTSSTASYYTITGATLRLVTDEEKKIAVPYVGDMIKFYPEGHW
jgi:hypothetical protein